MPDYELHVRTYEDDLTAELRLLRDGEWRLRRFRAGQPVFDEQRLDPGGVAREDDIKRVVDEMVARSPTAPWTRVLECPVCQTRNVTIDRVPEHHQYDVQCPHCRPFRISGIAFLLLGDARTAAPERLVDLSEYLKTRPADDDDMVSSESWAWMADQGRQRRRRAEGS